MKSIFLSTFFLLFGTTVSTDEVKNLERSSQVGHGQTTTYVVNHEFCSSCLSEEDKENKTTLEEVHTYAELKNDPRADLPSSFTICSSVMTYKYLISKYGSWQLFFTLLGKDRNPWLGSALRVVDEETSFYYKKDALYVSDVRLPPVFSHQWVRSCMAVNSESGLLQWVVNGTLVENATFSHVKESNNMPTDLTGRIVLGAGQIRKWSMLSNRVTNLNIFTTDLTIEEMQKNTMQGRCAPEGDYLAWRDMQWKLKGDASIETVDEKEPCIGQPFFNLYPEVYPSMQSCKYLCGNLGSRSPPIVTVQQWTNLKKVLEERLNNSREPPLIWLSLNDINREGEWVDDYDGKLVNFSLIPWAPNEPNGGRIENCAILALPPESGEWKVYDVSCDNPNWRFACMCERNPVPLLRLRGLCPGSIVRDTLYQPINNLTDFTRSILVGLRTSIEFDMKEKTWVMTDAESNVTGISTLESLTLGKHNWTFRGDMGCSRNGAEYTTELKMFGCQEGNFICNDGQCVSMDQKCDQMRDCRDESDEKICKVLVLKEGYNKNARGNGECVHLY